MPPKALTLSELCPRWEGVFPGTRVQCKSPLIGREVVLKKGESPVEILGCTAPVEMPGRAREKLSARRRCEGGFEVRFKEGLKIPFAVRGSKVRERLRVREGLCPDALVLDPHSGFVSYTERESERSQRSPYEGGELPFPHRMGSTPCCRNSAVYPDKVGEALAEVLNGDGFLEPSDVVSMAQKMVPKALRSRVVVERLEDVPHAIQSVRSHCWDIVRQWEQKHERAAVSSSARESSALRRLEREASDRGETLSRTVGVGPGARRVEVGWTDIEDRPKNKRRKALTYFKAG